MTHTAEALTAITPVSVSAVSFDRFGSLLAQHPRVAAQFLLNVQRERVALMDQLSAMRRTSAQSRLAAFLTDLLERLGRLAAVKEDSFTMRLTQEQIGDVLGLTSVHVNRLLRDLEELGLIARDRQVVRILDRQALVRLAVRPHRTLRTDLPWLPPHR
ncbi:Crp/Fnr family transcriptional regulator [Sphingomonas gellani]|uniref:Crp/Fnr family transcriptional regulator n=1 Tax=Sphingomonas gellani TaxID=1166340 RepID=UPI00147DBE70|nr:Crp/Fnr family transcriptional regulator [Sphingomonas gellani]